MSWTCTNDHTNNDRVNFCATCGEDQPARKGGGGPSSDACPICRRPAARGDSGALLYRGLCIDCGRCHGQTALGRCTFRSESFPDGRRHGFCAWHDHVIGNHRADTLAELSHWATVLLEAKVCDRWTHFTPLMIWEGMEGKRGPERVAPCLSDSCPHAVQADPTWYFTPQQNAAALAVVKAVLNRTIDEAEGHRRIDALVPPEPQATHPEQMRARA